MLSMGFDESQAVSSMDLRFQGITGQASSQIAVSQQAAKNDANLISYDRQMNGIANDGVRYSPLYSGPAAQPGGGARHDPVSDPGPAAVGAGRHQLRPHA